MLLFSFAGLLLFRVDDDKLLELLFQLPPRIPRADEPTIPIALPVVSGSTQTHTVCVFYVRNPRTHTCCLTNR